MAAAMDGVIFIVKIANAVPKNLTQLCLCYYASTVAASSE